MRAMEFLEILDDIDIYLFLYWMKIQSFVDKYIFGTDWCPYHGYECHGRCPVVHMTEKEIRKAMYDMMTPEERKFILNMETVDEDDFLRSNRGRDD